MTKNTVIIGKKVQDDILDALDNNRKIGAIKLFRNETGCGLRESKDAVEQLYYLKSGKGINNPKAINVLASPVVKKIICDFGSGDVEMDLETMELKVLTDLHTIGLDQCARLLELCETLKRYSRGEI